MINPTVITGYRQAILAGIQSKPLSILSVISLICILTSCGVTVPLAQNDQKPTILLTMTVENQGITKQYASDGDINVLTGSVIEFVVDARNPGGVENVALTLQGGGAYQTQGGSPQNARNELFLVFTDQSNPVTKITHSYNQAGTFTVIATATNYNNFPPTTLTVRVHVVNTSDAYINTCGTFNLDANTDATHSDHPIMQTSLTYTFNNPACTSSCCGTKAFVQMIRFFKPSGEVFQPNGEQQSRMVSSNDVNLNGWAIDRIEGRISPYYGQNDDGTWELILSNDPLGLGKISFGTNSTTIHDGIGATNSDYIAQVASFAICMGSSTCTPTVLDYYAFSFQRVNGEMKFTMPTPTPATSYNMRTAFNLAIDKWNNQGGKNKLIVAPGI